MFKKMGEKSLEVNILETTGIKARYMNFARIFWEKKKQVQQICNTDANAIWCGRYPIYCALEHFAALGVLYSLWDHCIVVTPFSSLSLQCSNNM